MSARTWELAAVAAALTLAAGCASDDPAPAAVGEPKLAWIQANVFTPGCAVGSSCHGSGSGAAGLKLSDSASAYATLVGVASAESDANGVPYARVEAGKPDRSLLWLVLQHPVGKTPQMPPGAPLAPHKVQAIKDWIASGALNN